MASVPVSVAKLGGRAFELAAFGEHGVDVVVIGQAGDAVAGRDLLDDFGVSAEQLHVVGFEVVEKLDSLFGAPTSGKGRHVARRRAEGGVGHADLSLVFRVGQIFEE